jgi:hypothetical protein
MHNRIIATQTGTPIEGRKVPSLTPYVNPDHIEQTPQTLSASPDFIRWALPRVTAETAEKVAAAFAKSSLFSTTANASNQLIEDMGMSPQDSIGRRILSEWMHLLRFPPPMAIAHPNGDDLVSTSKTLRRNCF